MHYVILRDDDTNALTPIEYLDILFRPFLERHLPVTLSVIPNVRTSTIAPDGEVERFLMTREKYTPETLPIGSNPDLVNYICANPGYRLAQHGYYHEYEEFKSRDGRQLAWRLDEGLRHFQEAGLSRASTFVAPQDKLSKEALFEVAKRFPVVSTSWYELYQISLRWWPQYFLRKLRKQQHWKAGDHLFLMRPTQQISYLVPYDVILENVKQQIRSATCCVVLTHWWEFFRNGRRDERLIEIYHQLADYLANDPEIKVISFDDLLQDQNLSHQVFAPAR